jgi:hypothetical protein
VSMGAQSRRREGIASPVVCCLDMLSLSHTLGRELGKWTWVASVKVTLEEYSKSQQPWRKNRLVLLCLNYLHPETKGSVRSKQGIMIRTSTQTTKGTILK